MPIGIKTNTIFVDITKILFRKLLDAPLQDLRATPSVILIALICVWTYEILLLIRIIL